MAKAWKDDRYSSGSPIARGQEDEKNLENKYYINFTKAQIIRFIFTNNLI